MLKRVELFNIAAVFLLITSIILIIYTMEREREFIAYNNTIQESSVISAAYVINLQLQNKHRLMRLFLEEYSQLFSYLENYPEHDITTENINIRLKQRFPDYFAFTITDQKGVPLLTDVESLVGDVCQNDLSTYAGRLRGNDASLRNEAYVHPQSSHYHYDIMAPLQTRYSGVRVFFSSFYLDEIADILKTHERPGQNLLLVRQTQPELIEVFSGGARDKLTRDSSLTDEERSRISVFQDIPDTDWRLVNLMDETSEQKYIDGLWTEVVVILIIVTFALITLVMVLVRRSRKEGNRE